MKNKIATGEFTPYVTNSWCSSRCMVDGVPYRSSQEAIFFIITGLPYEIMRIPYVDFDASHRTYIIDFHDEIEKILYEIKPTDLIDTPNVKLKELYAKNWCEKNGWTYQFINEAWFNDNLNSLYTNIDNHDLDDRTYELINNYVEKLRITDERN